LNILIQRSNTTSGTLTVDLSAASTTAVAGTDYNLTTGTLEFVDGESQKTVVLGIIDNTLQDGDKKLTLSLSNLTGSGTLDSAASSMQITIVDDDSSAPTPSDGGSSGGGGGGSFDSWLLLAILVLFLVTRGRSLRNHSRNISGNRV
jgi:hypothetical protein